MSDRYQYSKIRYFQISTMGVVDTVLGMGTITVTNNNNNNKTGTTTYISSFDLTYSLIQPS